MIATPDSPCLCGNTDYSGFWCDRCKRPEDEGFLSVSTLRRYKAFSTPLKSVITNDDAIQNLMRIHHVDCK